jgi:D-lactate dehydrogenase (cytochrome)
MRENVLNLTAVLADGTIIKTGSRARKSSAGYDITRLLIGSEGTLAVITEATLKLHPIPIYSYAMKVCFPTVFDAASAATSAIKSGVSLGRAEMIDEKMVQIINESAVSVGDDIWPEKVTLLFEVTGSTEIAVNEQLKLLKSVVNHWNSSDEILITNKEDNIKLWNIRKQAAWLVFGKYPNREALITDSCVPLSKLPDMISRSKLLLDQSSLPSPIIAHAG